MKRVMALLVSAAIVIPTIAEDKKELKLPDLKAKEWKEVKDGDGLKLWDVKEGKGEAVPPLAKDKAAPKVKVHYTGWTTDGNIFDSSVQRGEPIEFALNRVIKGWGNGVPGMKPGGVRRLYIPAKLAYGEEEKKDRTGKVIIPANSDLVFEVELIEIK